MSANPHNLSDSSGQADWHPAKPDVVPQPTIWPASVALAVTLSLWGLASSPIISLIGICLFIVSLTGWIGDIRHEGKTL